MNILIKIKMLRIWGILRNISEALPKLQQQPNRHKLKSILLFILFTNIFSFRIVSSCPLSLPSPLSPIQLDYHDGNHGNQGTQAKQHLLETSRNSTPSSSSATSSLLTSILFKVVIFLMKSFMGDQWFLSKDVAFRRLDDLKTSLFNYYGN